MNEDERKENLSNENSEEKKETPTTSLLKKGGRKNVEDITSKLEKVVESREKETKDNKIPLIIGVIVIIIVAVVLFFVLSGKKGIVKTSGTGITSGGSDYVEMKIVETTKEGKKIVKTKIVKKSEIEKVKKELATKSPNVKINVKELTKKEVEQKKKEIAQNVNPQPEETPNKVGKEITNTPPKAEESKAPANTPPTEKKEVKPAPVVNSIKPTIKKVETIKPTIQKSATKKANTLKVGDLVPLDSTVIPPKLIKKHSISKPIKARFSHRSGIVILRVLIDENGNVKEAKVVSENPKNFGFGKAASNGVKSFKFTPARKNGIRVKVWKTLVIKF